ncbi:MAG: hypothetical protein HXY46_02255 [Syntrophaceae bacterium]|nr:hypothetical protein [Syntrophaceae bacterium]
MKKKNRKEGILFFSALFLLLFLAAIKALPQPAPKEEPKPQVSLGEVMVKFKEFESKPSPLKILELHVEILNQSRDATAPAGSVKVVATPLGMRISSNGTTSEFPSDPQEMILDRPIPPRSGQVVIFGFPFPREDPDSATFEIQINPPEGEKRTVTWESDKN